MSKSKPERQTTYSLQEIVDRLTNNRPSPKLCLLINELGAIVFNGEDEDEKGEKMLVHLLDHIEDAPRLIAHCYLSSTPSLAEKHAALLTAFWEKPENNKEMRDWANMQMDNFKKNYC